MTWSPDSQMIATGSDDSNIRLWDIESGELVRTLEGHQGSIWSVAWSGHGQWLASGATDRTVRVWEASSGRLVRTLEGHQSAVTSVAWSGDGQWVASGADDGTVRVWDMESGTELAVYQSRCPFRKFGASRTSCPRRWASSPRGARPLDSRFRGNDARLQKLAVYV